MGEPRFFIHGAAAHAADLRDRAAAHGAVIAVKAYAAPGPSVYGCTEIEAPTSHFQRSNEGEKQEGRIP